MEMAEMASGGAGARCGAVTAERETTGFVSSSRDAAKWVTSAADRFRWRRENQRTDQRESSNEVLLL